MAFVKFGYHSCSYNYFDNIVLAIAEFIAVSGSTYEIESMNVGCNTFK